MIKNLDDRVTPVTVARAGVSVPQRAIINFTGTVTVTDNPDTNSTDVNVGGGVGGVMTPVNQSPVSGAINTTNTPVLQASPYQSVNGLPQYSIEVQIFAVSDLVNPIHTNTVPGAHTSYTVGVGVLSQGVQYYWWVRYKEDGGAYSAWSSMTSFTTSVNSTVNTPTNVLPAGGSTEIGQTPMLTSSAFSVTGSSDTHELSQWRIRTSAGNYSSPVWDSGFTPTNLTSIYVTLLANLQPATVYYWQVRHKGVNFGWSAWSSETSFTTASVFDLGTLLWSSTVATSPFTVANIRNGDSFANTIPAPSIGYSSNYFSAISPDSNVFVTKGVSNSYVTLWLRNGGVVSKINDFLVGSFTGAGQAVHGAWSHDGKYVAIGLVSVNINPVNAENIMIRNQNNTLSAISLTGTTQVVNSSYSVSCAWSPDDTHVAFLSPVSPFCTIWKNNGNDTFTKISTPFDFAPTIPYNGPSQLNSSFISYSPDGTYLAMGVNAAPYLRLYKRSGDTYTLLPDANITGKLAVSVLGVAWSPDSQILYTTHLGGTRQVTAYSRNLDTFTKITDAALDAAIGNSSYHGCSVSVSQDGNYVAVGISATPFQKIFKKTGATSFTALTFTSSHTAAVRHTEFDRDTN